MLLDKDLIQKITFFENITKARVKDCFSNEVLIFIVNFGDFGKAVGLKGRSIKKVESLFKRKIKIVEFNNNPINFVKNLIMPLKVNKIEKNGDYIEVSADRKTNGILIGRDGRNLKEYNKIIKRYFDLELKVV